MVIGTVFDVFVDLWKESPTYGQQGGVEFAAEKFNRVYIPRGFAHGFCPGGCSGRDSSKASSSPRSGGST
ncbi:MAG: dTDP-4-dehydrorhamnose 3,5-epimerase family protein [Anaerolineae bacterium]|nr:dTDP-4-dehydrorhamnose 3,5-epimerase family protein [Anaerolineae bacterium]